MIYLPIGSRKDDFLLSKKIPFLMETTNNSKKIIVGKKQYLETEKRLSFKQLNFIKKVKAHVSKLPPLDKSAQYNTGQICYHQTRISEQPQEIFNTVEYDINTAYWVTAYTMGFINHDLFMQGLEMSKMARLVALGSLATTKKYWRYDGKGECEVYHTEYNEQTRHFFFNISHQVGLVLMELFDTCNGFFSWVDAVFIPSDKVKTADKVLKFHGLLGKTKPVYKIEVITEPLQYKIHQEKDNPIRNKTFMVRSRKTIRKRLSLYEKFKLNNLKH